MKIETILNALVVARDLWVMDDLKARLGIAPRHLGKEEKLLRQHRTFRARILRMDKEKDAEIKHLKETCCHD